MASGIKIADAYVDVHADTSGLKAETEKATEGGGIFGSVGGKLATGMVAGFAAVGVAKMFTGFISDAQEAAKLTRITDQVILTTGGSAKVATKDITDLAGAIQAKTGIDDAAIQSGENMLLTFTNIANQAGEGNDIFTQSTKIMVDMSVATGTDMKSASVQLGKALNDPIKGVSALTKVGVSFTQQQKDQIKALQESGDMLGAQKIILGEVNKEFGGAAEAAASPLDRLKGQLSDLGKQVASNLLPVIDKVATWLGEKLPIAIDVVGGFFTTKLMPPIREISGWIRDTMVPAIERVVDAMGGWEKVGKIVGGAIAVLVAPLAVLVGGVIYAYTHFQAFHDIIDRVVQFITGTVVPAVQRMAASVMVEIGALAAWWNAHWDAIQEAVGHVWVAIQAIVDTALNLISQAWDAWGGRFMSIVSAVWSQIQAYVQAAIAVVRGIIQLVIDLINGDWGKAWNDILGILSAVWELIKSTVQNALTIVQNLLGVALDALWKAMQAGWDVILGVVNVAWEGIKSVAGAAMTWLGDRLHDLFVELPGKLLDVVTNVGVAVIGFIISGLTAAWDAYWRFTEKLHDFFAELPAKILDGITAVGTFIVTNLWSGLTTAWDTVWDLEKKLGDALRGAADAMVSVASELGSKIVNAIVDGIKSGPSVIIDAIKSLIPGSGVLGDVGNKVSGWLGFADGGVVPGAIGAPVPALVHGGEVILNPQQQARVRGMIAGGVGSSGGDVYNVSVTLDAKNVKDWTDVVNIIKGAAVAQRAGRRS